MPVVYEQSNYLTSEFWLPSQHRWTRGRSKERFRQQTLRDAEAEDFDSDATDYAADNSSDSATQSPRHRPGIAGSPLARIDNNMRTKSDSITTQQSFAASIDASHPVASGSKDSPNDAVFVSTNPRIRHCKYWYKIHEIYRPKRCNVSERPRYDNMSSFNFESIC